MNFVTRFAPSPTGHLHIGHAATALTAWQLAHEAGGRFLLRIEDIDPTRCRPLYTQDLMEDLRWLGLSWEEPVRIQSEHMADYRAALGRLSDMGVLYPCFCTRSAITQEIARAGYAPHSPDASPYLATCKILSHAEQEDRIAAGQPYALRLDMAKALALAGPLTWEDALCGPQTESAATMGDVVLARKETPTSYHLSVVVDDALQGVTMVTRGADLFHVTPLHRLLQALLGLPVPVWRHHPLITDIAGERLSKRNGALSLRTMREQGKTPSEIFEMIKNSQRYSHKL